MGSETTAAAAGATGTVRRDPFAMLPFCGYHMASYLNHWLQFGREIPDPPRIFDVNWFRRTRTASSSGPASARTCASSSGSSSGRTVMRVGIESPLGWMPRYEDLDWRGLEDFPRERFVELMSVDREFWATELLSHEELFGNLFDRLPKEMIFVRQLLLSALFRSPEHWQFDSDNGAG